MNDDNHKRHVNLHQNFSDSIEQDVAKKKAKRQAEKLQDRKDMFLAAILTGMFSNQTSGNIYTNSINRDMVIEAALKATDTLMENLNE